MRGKFYQSQNGLRKGRAEATLGVSATRAIDSLLTLFSLLGQNTLYPGHTTGVFKGYVLAHFPKFHSIIAEMRTAKA